MLRNSHLTVPLLLTFLLFSVDAAAPLRILSLDYTRELTENDKTERTAGTLHYDVNAARVVVEVSEPLKQILVVTDKALEIYYPEDKQAFRFIFEGRIPLPFVESIIQSTQVEYGLADIGYTLAKHVVADEVLYTHWAPPEKAADKLAPSSSECATIASNPPKSKTLTEIPLQRPGIRTTAKSGSTLFR